MKSLHPRTPTLGASASTGGWQPDAQRGNRHARGYGTAWEKLRKEIIERDKGLCQPCIAKDRLTPFRDVDHRVSKAQARRMGWSQDQVDDPSNLQCICGPCHDAKTSEESRR